MLLATDVHYHPDDVVTACLAFADWPATAPRFTQVVHSGAPPAPYAPGRFFERELPPLLAALRPLLAAHDVRAIIVDAHAVLDAGRPGLGAHLHAALAHTSHEHAVPVVGVAKNPFRDSPALPVLRGESARPLWVSAVGCDPAVAAAGVAAMAGPHRVPLLLKAVDHLARGLPLPPVLRPPPTES